MIVHAKSLGFTAQRIGFKVKKTAAAKKVPVAKKAPAAKAAVPVKKKVAAKKATPAREAVAKKAATAKAAPAKKAVASKKSSAAIEPKQTPEAVQFKRIVNGLARMGDKRPERLKSFLRHIESMLGKDTKPAAVQKMVQQLQSAGAIQIAGERVVHT